MATSQRHSPHTPNFPGTSTRALAAPAAGIADIRIDFGPRELLGPFFLKADSVLRSLGVSLSFGTFDELGAINRANRDTWLPLIPTFDPANGLCDPERGYVLIGRNAQGRAVTAQATLICDWSGTSFLEVAQGMRLFYADPASRAQQQEACVVTAPSAAQLTGTVAFLGSGWWHPSVRGLGLGTLLSRISRVYAYTRWRPDLTMAIMSERLLNQGFAARNGYPHIEAGVGFRGFAMGHYDGGMVWITADELLDELRAFMVTLEARLDDLGRLRTA